jgi:ABC-2 type transport system ATP-binding protein
MREVCFIADVAVLPRWMRVSQALDYVAGVHPRFDRAKAESLLAKTDIHRSSRVKQLSKGMVTQLHLALVMAIDAKLLVLDEPTLGLDILYRKQFYDSLLNDYFDRSRTIVVTTHQVDDVQNVLTDLMFINHGRIILSCSMEDFESRYLEVTVRPEQVTAARALNPIHERQVLGRSILLFDRGVNPNSDKNINQKLDPQKLDRQQLAALGDVRTPGIADLFVAVMGDKAGNKASPLQGASR